ncbi:MAG: hypothetical protein ACKVOM_08175 [Ferruginibacter sp.]
MKKYFIIFTILFAAFSTKAQNSCAIKSGQAYYYEVISGVSNTTLSTTGNEVRDKIEENLNVSIYLVTTCDQPPLVSYSRFGKKKITLEFIKISSDSDQEGYDMTGEIKVIKVPKGGFLWKATCPLKNKSTYIEKEKLFIKGIIGGKKFNYTISYIQKLQALPMY